MSLSAAVKSAVWDELASEGRGYPVTGQEVMSTDYKYDDRSIREFLAGVALLLKADTPSLTFAWATLDTSACLSDTVTTLCGYIASVTS